MRDNIRAYVKMIRQKTSIKPLVAIILGSGLGDFGESLDQVVKVPYADLPDFPVSTVANHRGRFLIGYYEGIPVICMQGRVHLYEGYTADQVAMTVRVMQGLGAKYLIVTNAAGGINSSYSIGDLALITDHISLFVPNPLIGPNDPEEGIRFPDMSCVYDKELRQIAFQVAESCGTALQKGVYAQLTGPSFETPAEIRMLRMMGADLVGMSTVVEVFTARHAGMRVVGLSLVANLAAGLSDVPLSDEDVQETGAAANKKFHRIVGGLIREIGKLDSQEA